MFVCCCSLASRISPPEESMIELIKAMKPDNVLMEHIMNNPECINEFDEVSIVQ